MLDSPELWVAVAFAGFIALLVYNRVPAVIAKALDDRADTIRKELDEARRLREQGQQLLADYLRKGREAEAEAQAIVDQARREAEAFAMETRKGLQETLERRTKVAEDKIARAEAQALTEVRAAAVDSALATAERLLKAKMVGSAGAALIEQGIRDLKGRFN